MKSLLTKISLAAITHRHILRTLSYSMLALLPIFYIPTSHAPVFLIQLPITIIYIIFMIALAYLGGIKIKPVLPNKLFLLFISFLLIVNLYVSSTVTLGIFGDFSNWHSLIGYIMLYVIFCFVYAIPAGDVGFVIKSVLRVILITAILWAMSFVLYILDVSLPPLKYVYFILSQIGSTSSLLTVFVLGGLLLFLFFIKNKIASNRYKYYIALFAVTILLNFFLIFSNFTSVFIGYSASLKIVQELMADGYILGGGISDFQNTLRYYAGYFSQAGGSIDYSLIKEAPSLFLTHLVTFGVAALLFFYLIFRVNFAIPDNGGDLNIRQKVAVFISLVFCYVILPMTFSSAVLYTFILAIIAKDKFKQPYLNKNILKLSKIIFIIFMAYLLLNSVSKIIQVNYFYEAANSINTSSLPMRVLVLDKANRAYPSDYVYRAKSRLLLEQARLEISTGSNKTESIDSYLTFVSKAIDSAKNAVKLNPDISENYISLASAYELAVLLNISDAYKEARSAYEIAHRVDPQNIDILLRHIKLNISTGNLTDNEKLFEIAEKIDKFDYRLLLLQSQIASASGDIDKALGFARMAVNNHKTRSDVRLHLSMIYYYKEMYEESKKELEVAVNLEGDNILALYYLSEVNYILGNFEQAKGSIEKLLKIDPNNKEAQDLLIVIDSAILSNNRTNLDFANQDITSNDTGFGE